MLSSLQCSWPSAHSISELLAVVLPWGQLWGPCSQHPHFTAEEAELRWPRRSLSHLAQPEHRFVGAQRSDHCASQPVGPGSILQNPREKRHPSFSRPLHILVFPPGPSILGLLLLGQSPRRPGDVFTWVPFKRQKTWTVFQPRNQLCLLGPRALLMQPKVPVCGSPLCPTGVHRHLPNLWLVNAQHFRVLLLPSEPDIYLG